MTPQDPLTAELEASPFLRNNLAQLSRELDPNRPVVLANCCEERGMKEVPVVAEAVDAVGANRYFGWYYSTPDQLGEHLDSLREKHPDIPLSVSEVGAGGAPNLHTDNPLGGPVDMGGRTQPEEFLTCASCSGCIAAPTKRDQSYALPFILRMRTFDEPR